MRVIVKIKSNVPKEGFRELIINNFKDYWCTPENESDFVRSLIDRVYPNVRPSINIMTNYAFAHKTIENCHMLISLNADDIEIRIFYDHIATLRELSGKFLKQFKTYIIKPHNYLFEHPNTVLISEAHNNNVLDAGVIALNYKDYISKTIKDRRSEFFLFCAISALAILTMVVTISLFHTPQKDTLIYELSSKCIAPFLASAILTGLNLLIFFWRLRTNTNIIWGHKYDY
jgi:hypothetical protein